MSVAASKRLLQRIPLRQISRQSSGSPICIRKCPVACIRSLNTRTSQLPLPYNTSRLPAIRCQRRPYATTIVHNQKYNEDNLPLTLEITPSCAKQLHKIHVRENNDNLMLRITVESGGCHGYQYLISLTEQYDPDEDALFESDGVKVVVDTISLGLVTGSKVDYSTELIGSQFKIVDNPAASSNCGCGSSFDLDFSKQGGKGIGA